MNMFISTWVLLVAGLVFALPMIHMRVQDSSREMDELCVTSHFLWFLCLGWSLVPGGVSHDALLWSRGLPCSAMFSPLTIASTTEPTFTTESTKSHSEEIAHDQLRERHHRLRRNPC